MDSEQKKAVLVVNNHSEVNEGIKNILEDNGFRVYIAGDYELGLKELAERSVNVVLADVAMPDGCAIEFMRQAREIKLVEVIMVSGHSTMEKCVTAIENGACGYISHPLSADEIVLNVGRAFRNLQEKTVMIQSALKEI